jgi:hypothetical protein
MPYKSLDCMLLKFYDYRPEANYLNLELDLLDQLEKK